MVHSHRASGIHVYLITASLLSVFTVPAAAQGPACTAPSTYSAYSGTDRKPIPAAPLFGSANSIVIDPTFGSSILRVTDQNTLSGQSFIPTDAGFHRTWNADATAIQVTGPHGDGYWIEFNPGSFTVGDGSSHPVLHPLPINADWEWSTVNPDIIYFLNGTQLAKYDKSTSVVTNLGAPTNGDPVTSRAVVVGQDNWVCSAAGTGIQNTFTELFCVDPAHPATRKLVDVLNKRINGVLQSDPNWPTSAGGQTIGIHSISGSTGASWLGVTFHQQSWGGNGDAVFNLTTNTWSLVTNADIYFSGHFSLGNGLFANGSGSVNGSDARGMVVRDANHLMDASKYLFIEQPPATVNWFDAEHSSWFNSLCNTGAPVLQSRYTLTNPSPWLPWIGEIVAAATDGSNTVWRFAHNHNLIGNYYGEAFAQISNDGKWALFSSPWDGTLGTSAGGDFGLSTRIDTFVVRLVPGSVATGPAIGVSPSVVAPGATVTFTLTNGPGNPLDALVWYCPATSGDRTYADYVYLNNTQTPPTTGVASATVTLRAPLQVGMQCEARWFANASAGSAPPLATSARVTVANPTPAISALGPASVAAGSAGFTLTVTGTGFVPGASAGVGGATRTTTFVSGTQLSVAVLANDVLTIGAPDVTVGNPGPCVSSGCTSGPQALQVVAPPAAPTITTLAPTTIAVGTAGFALTVTGTNFAATSVVQVDGVSRPTTFSSATTLMAQLPASDRVTGGTHAITVRTPAPGGGTSNATTLTVTGPTIAVSPLVVGAGGLVTFTLTNGPANPMDALVWYCPATGGDRAFVDYVYLNNTQTPPTTGVASATVTLRAPLQVGMQCEARWFANASAGSAPPLATSARVTVANPTPAIGALGPASVAAGSAGFTLTVTGAGFVPGATVQVNGTGRTTTMISATQLTVAVLVTDVASIGPAPITVANPPPCVSSGCTSVGVALTVVAPPSAPTLTTLAPATVVAGPTGFALTVTGTNFVGTSVVQVDGVSRPTTFSSATTLMAQLPASDRATGGTHAITVGTPAPGGGTSNATTLTVTGPTIVASPLVVPPGGLVTFTLTNGPGNPLDALVWYCPATGGDRAFVDYVYLNNTQTPPTTGVTSATVTLRAPLQAGMQCEARWFANASAGSLPPLATSARVTVANPVPAITTLSPATMRVGSAASTLTVNGTGFVATSVVQINGASRTTTFVSSTQLQAMVLASDVTTLGATPAVCVVTGTPGGGTSTPCATLTVVTGPAIAVSPTVVAPGGLVTFTLTNGPANPMDALVWYCPATGGDRAFVDYVYLNNTQTPPGTGVPGATVTLRAPLQVGAQCEARWFANASAGSAPPLATSATVTVN